MPSSDHSESCRRPQQFFLDHDTIGPSFHFSSPSPGSPRSPRSPLPWESPKLKPQHSYMNPTASSMAKSSRSSSLGEGIQIRTPPGSPSFPKSRRSCGELEAPLLASSPVTASSASPLLSGRHPHPTAAVSPTALTQNVPPSRIPLPKQPLSPRRSLCLDMSPSASWSGGLARACTPTADPGCDVTPAPGSQGETAGHILKMSKKLESRFPVCDFESILLPAARVRQPSLSPDHSLPSSLPIKQKRSSASERYIISKHVPLLFCRCDR